MWGTHRDPRKHGIPTHERSSRDGSSRQWADGWIFQIQLIDPSQFISRPRPGSVLFRSRRNQGCNLRLDLIPRVRNKTCITPVRKRRTCRESQSQDGFRKTRRLGVRFQAWHYRNEFPLGHPIGASTLSSVDSRACLAAQIVRNIVQALRQRVTCSQVRAPGLLRD
jgi:hypothetical protein